LFLLHTIKLRLCSR